MACKSDASKEVDPHTAATMLRDHKVGLVEVSMYDDSGKDKMRRCLDWMIRAIYRDRCAHFLPYLFVLASNIYNSVNTSRFELRIP
jgi:hypothetical protein